MMMMVSPLYSCDWALWWQAYNCCVPKDLFIKILFRILFNLKICACLVHKFLLVVNSSYSILYELNVLILLGYS